MRKVRLPVEQTVESLEDRDFVLERRHRRQLGLQIVVGADLVWVPTARRAPEAPEPGAEPRRQRRAGGEQGATTVQEVVEIRQRDRKRASLKQPSKNSASIQHHTHCATSFVAPLFAADARGAPDENR